MKKTIRFLLAVMLSACGLSETPKYETPKQTNVPTVEELASNPERLKELRQQCKTDRSILGDVLCNRVAEATRKRFIGDGKVPYTPPENPPNF
ncbi:entry exclusion lipoprotein TrbK [Pseudoxanthomonas sp. X-1]|uniref:entry exclusion lipoprotein TrbK n=1 Tax=Pseudoxanthomonas sp. X-1 TaxID=2571115 RepID=UPI00110BFD9C|nr:entry exclusion lipoprotein TrbK [Pseudoxanthomonas sp. X-1]TMN19402.1 entry exclusion lipoprotein TrbK [Pseudoxanthomonas sp. X-1]UAY75335.1 entry exclusion lipoprotein TrbK [Pseudoxanthomonas sp. X-1]